MVARRGLLRILSGVHPLGLLGERHEDEFLVRYPWCRISDMCLQLPASGRAQYVAIAVQCTMCDSDMWGRHCITIEELYGRPGDRRGRMI